MFIGKKPSPWSGLVVTALVALGVAVAAVGGGDMLCRRDIARRLPLYPGASLQWSEHDFLRVRAAGRSSLIFATPDDLETVRAWNRRVTLELLEAERSRGVADLSRRFEAAPEGGTLIYDSTRCGL